MGDGDLFGRAVACGTGISRRGLRRVGASVLFVPMVNDSGWQKSSARRHEPDRGDGDRHAGVRRHDPGDAQRCERRRRQPGHWCADMRRSAIPRRPAATFRMAPRSCAGSHPERGSRPISRSLAGPGTTSSAEFTPSIDTSGRKVMSAYARQSRSHVRELDQHDARGSRFPAWRGEPGARLPTLARRISIAIVHRLKSRMTRSQSRQFSGELAAEPLA